MLETHRRTYEVMRSTIQKNSNYLVNQEAEALAQQKLNIRAAQSIIWSEIPLVSSSSSYLFNVKFGVPNAGNSGILASEVRLKDQDVFFSYAFKFALRAVSNPAGSTDWGCRLMTFPSADLFGPLPAAVPGLFTFQALWNFGRMSIKVNGETTTPIWDLSQHLSIPQTQIPAPWSGNPPYDELAGGDDGWCVTEPNWILNGANNNEFIVDYGANYQLIKQASIQWSFTLVAIWQGFLAQNVSSIMNSGTVIKK